MCSSIKSFDHAYVNYARVPCIRLENTDEKTVLSFYKCLDVPYVLFPSDLLYEVSISENYHSSIIPMSSVHIIRD